MNTITSKRRLGWAGLAALLGCSAMCALPIFAAAGLGGSGAAAFARRLRPGTEIAVATVVFATLLGLLAVRSRSRRRSGLQSACGGSCDLPLDSTDSVREPASKRGEQRTGLLFSRAAVATAPIVCSADLTHAQVQIDGYRAAFHHLVGSERFADGFRWTFLSVLGLESQLRGLAEREADCCRFFSYELLRDGQNVVWEVRGRGNASSLLDEYFQLPERLREETRQGRDVAALKRAAAAAGLQFIAERKQGPA